MSQHNANNQANLCICMDADIIFHDSVSITTFSNQLNQIQYFFRESIEDDKLNIMDGA